MLDSQQIRRAFVNFFVERGHTHLSSLPLIPSDPSITTLFIIAGMQQMIPYFLGREEPPNSRLVTVQRGLRTADIEEVGDDSHLTFLEMLGNFSVGDYFKREALSFTWEFLTRTLGVSEGVWYATIYPGDDEARQAWIAAGLAAERIGETEENWWAQGPVGPCGPDSEIFFDRGKRYSCGQPDCRPENECCDRFIETWNNVFMTYYQDESGEMRDLPWKNIDTGMGLERLAMVVQGVDSVYETDLFQPIIRAITEITGHTYGNDVMVDRSLRIIADHSRAITFLIADGVMPSSEGRGYVLRRLLRRAAMHGRLLGVSRPFLAEPVEAVIAIMEDYYSYLHDRHRHIEAVVQQDEERFLKTLERGLVVFEEMAARAATNGNTISGKDTFVLSDTHGFPLELSEELAATRGLSVDREGFNEALRRQQERARSGRAFLHQAGTSPEVYALVANRVGNTTFTGYDELTTTTEIAAILAEGREVIRAEAGDQVEVILAATPFYAESGGQVGDTGVLHTDNGLAEVEDTQRPHAALIVHRATIHSGSIAVGDVVEAEVDAERRIHILPHHSGTHLLHKALQEVLGPEAVQAGSLVAPDRLRFDFRWPRPLSQDELREVQDRVNAAIWANLPVRTDVESYEDAVKEGAMALFGEKYGDRVRVVRMGNWSKELCGGTHVNATGDIGLLVVVGETGIGSGVRRVEALAGAAAYAYLNGLRDVLTHAAGILETQPENLENRAQLLVEELRDERKRVSSLAQRLAAREAESLLAGGIPIDGFTVVADKINADSDEYLDATVDAVRARLERGIVVLATVVEGRPSFRMAVTRNLRDAGYEANTILRKAAAEAQGGAGGSPEFARGGGRDASKVDQVLQAAVEIIRERAKG